MVLSRSGKHPHLVKCGKGGRVSCDSDCPNWKSLNICSHCVVAAETNNCLCEFVDYYRKSKRLPSVTRLLLTGVSSGVGRKGNRVSRKRKVSEVTTRIQSSPVTTPTTMLPTSPAELTTHIQASSTTMISTPPSHTADHTEDAYHTLPAAALGNATYPTNRFSNTVPGSNSVYNLPGVHMPSMSINTGTGYVSAMQNWLSPHINCHTPQVNAQNWMSPVTSDSSEFRLYFRTGNISVCNGSKNRFDKTASPPNDLCIQHEEWRSFLSPTGLPELRYGNAYYHANPACIVKKWPHFNPSLLVIISPILSRLLPQHKSIISSLFGITLV